MPSSGPCFNRTRCVWRVGMSRRRSMWQGQGVVADNGEKTEIHGHVVAALMEESNVGRSACFEHWEMVYQAGQCGGADAVGNIDKYTQWKRNGRSGGVECGFGEVRGQGLQTRQHGKSR